MDVRLSKIVSYALRHAPQEYSLKLDNNGWVDIDALLSSLRSKHIDFLLVTKDEFVAIFGSKKNKRHEIEANSIRAKYGHSLKSKINKPKSVPPEILFHGTTLEAIETIKKEGLSPMNRQYLHLSISVDLAREVALRKTKKPIVIKVKAKLAYDSGSSFYDEKILWLSDGISPEFLIFDESEGIG